MNLEGMVIVVTGGGDGIGRECALAYAREKGVVVILDSNLESARRTAADLGRPNSAVLADVSDGASVQAALAAVIGKFGRIAAIHNNAGIASPSKP
jgi:meso-butanediol dehydrogenase/(S,S)-butanediol dehydrogenase/diacetyl reductase